MAVTPLRLLLNGNSKAYQAGEVFVLEGDIGASLLQQSSAYYKKVHLVAAELGKVVEPEKSRGQLILDGLDKHEQPEAPVSLVKDKEDIEKDAQENPFNEPNPQVDGPPAEPVHEATDIPADADTSNLPKTLEEVNSEVEHLEEPATNELEEHKEEEKTAKRRTRSKAV